MTEEKKRRMAILVDFDTWLRLAEIKARLARIERRVVHRGQIINRALDLLEREMEGEDE